MNIEKSADMVSWNETGTLLTPDIDISMSGSCAFIIPFQTQNVICSYILSFHFSFQEIITKGSSFILQKCYLQVSMAFSTAYPR